MGQISLAEFGRNPGPHVDAVCDSHTPLVVMRPDGDAAVVMAEEDYRGLLETIHLLSSPANAARLRQSIAELSAGGGVEYDPTL